ncbi:BQ2448_3542 [Microbotryum intermedium]|uniref:BQ2448_3542 protein n=1 Tax=Microbotryum intermedium TaxID=269621 RepID=A0A238FAA6_9BASI|nr:BQ2448_3542 [Microbotryum intermedium]
MAPRKTFIAGVGMTAFMKPRNLIDYPELAVEAATKALLDAGINYDEVEQAYAGYVYGDSTCGQRALYALGMTAIPIVNVNNNCSTGSSALFLARQMVEAGVAECIMALGFEKMAPGSLTNTFSDRSPPLEKTIELMNDVVGVGAGPFAAQIFGNGAEEYCQKYGSTWKDVASIAAKNHKHSAANPYSQFRNVMTTEEVYNDKKVTDNMTRGMCCPTSDGAACAIVVSEDFVKEHNLQNQAIEMVAQAMTTDSPRLFNDRSSIELTGADMTRIAAQKCYKQAGIKPDDLSVIELHDCFAANELLVYDALQLTAPGKAHELARSGDNTYGGKFVINPSGGLESKGHPLGATGLGMVFYLVNQLRGWAGPMQDPRCVPGAAERQGKECYALAHNLGLGGSCVVTILKRPGFFAEGGADGRARLGYNHAAECKSVTQTDVDKVKSRKQYSKFADVNLAEA